MNKKIVCHILLKFPLKNYSYGSIKNVTIIEYSQEYVQANPREDRSRRRLIEFLSQLQKSTTDATAGDDVQSNDARG